MKAIQTSQTVVIPEGVTVDLDGRKVKVTGPRGTLEKNFNHVSVEITRQGKNKLNVAVWFGARKHLACIRTVCTHIKNMITGVTKGFQYKMRAAYSHFPINVSIVDGKKTIEIRNYLGEKIVRRVPMADGVTVDVTDQKDEIVLKGASLDAVSQSAATIQQITAVKNKDTRKFLDGIYVSERSTVVRD
jgi:large subunit ribosomal protein L9e